MTNRPPLTIDGTLTLADAWHVQTGRWPGERDGPEWKGITSALRYGWRGLPGGSSMPQLLAERRGVRNPLDLPRLTLPRILAWTKAHHRRTGKWPNAATGPVVDAPGETWRRIHDALCFGHRGLSRGPGVLAGSPPQPLACCRAPALHRCGAGGAGTPGEVVPAARRQ